MYIAHPKGKERERVRGITFRYSFESVIIYSINNHCVQIVAL